MSIRVLVWNEGRHEKKNAIRWAAPAPWPTVTFGKREQGGV